MHFAHCARLNGHECGGEIGSNGEGGCVDDFYGTAGDSVGLLLREVVRVGIFLGKGAGGTSLVLSGDIGGCGCAIENVELFLGKVVKGGDGGLEVFGEYGFGVAEHHFADEDYGRVLVKRV